MISLLAQLLTSTRAVSALIVATVVTHSGAQTTEPYYWDNVAIGGGGYLTGVTVAPSQPGLLIARSDVAGPFIRSSAAERWNPLTWDTVAPTPLQGANGAAIHPTNADIMFLELGQGGTNTGLFRSSDRGASWTRVLQKYSHSSQSNTSTPALAAERLARFSGPTIAIDPLNPSVIYWGTMKDGIWRSTTGGSSGWTQLRAPAADEATPGTRAIAIDSRTALNGRSSVVYASVYGKGVYRSTDAGDTYSLLVGSPTQPLKFALGADGILYVGHMTGVARFDGSWGDITPPDRVGQRFFAVDVDPLNPARIVVFPIVGRSGSTDATNFLYRSINRGTNWESIPRSRLVSSGPISLPVFLYPYQAVASVTLDRHSAGRAYIADAYMVWQTNDIWSTTNVVWTAQSNYLETTIGLALCTPPASANNEAPFLLSGVSDVAGFRHADIAATPMSVLPLSPPDSRYGYYYRNYYNTGYDYCESNSSVIWVNTEDYNKYCTVFRSTDGGQTWSTPRKPNGDTRSPASRIAASATDPLRAVWVPSNNQQARYTMDGGATWLLCKQTNGNNLPSLSGWSDAYSNDLHVAADRVDGLTFYAYGSYLNVAGLSPLWITRDGGATWSRSSTVLPGRGSFNAYSTPVVLEAAPGRGGDIWVSLGTNGIWRSTDFGQSFVKQTAFKGSTPQALSFGKPAPGAPANQPSLYVWGTRSTDATNAVGLYRSLDLGTNWTRISTLPGLLYALPRADRQVYGRVYLATGTHSILVGVPDNLLSNGGFENGVTGWVTSNNAASVIPANPAPPEGARCVRIPAGYGGVHQIVQAGSGESYSFSAWGRRTATSSNPVRLVVRALNSSDVLISQPAYLSVTSTSWTQVSRTFTTPAGTAKLQVMGYTDYPTPESYVDGFVLTPQ